MKLASLESAVREHAGQFLCERINAPTETKMVDFRHVVASPIPLEPLPNVGGLIDFYETFGSVVFYFDERSGEAAKHIASPAAWGELADEFGGWLSPLEEQERAELLPDWIEECLVIGEEPRAGNYILMPTAHHCLAVRCSRATRKPSAAKACAGEALAGERILGNCRIRPELG